jgi:hypothetical protein
VPNNKVAEALKKAVEAQAKMQAAARALKIEIERLKGES